MASDQTPIQGRVATWSLRIHAARSDAGMLVITHNYLVKSELSAKVLPVCAQNTCKVVCVCLFYLKQFLTDFSVSHFYLKLWTYSSVDNLMLLARIRKKTSFSLHALIHITSACTDFAIKIQLTSRDFLKYV